MAIRSGTGGLMAGSYASGVMAAGDMFGVSQGGRHVPPIPPQVYVALGFCAVLTL